MWSIDSQPGGDGDTPFNDNVNMFSLILLRSNSFKNNSVSLAQVPRYYFQRILLPKPTLTHVLRDLCNVRFLRASKLHISCLRSDVFKHNERILAKKKPCYFTCVRRLQSSSLDINTNITNNVFLYKYERPRLFTFLKVFAPFQCIFWIVIGYFLYQLLPKRDPNEQQISTYLWDNFINVLLFSTAITIGTTSALLIWAFVARSVRYVVLKKGGKAVTFITYHPLKGKVNTTVPIEHISCKTARRDMTSYLSIKLKGRKLFYILDSGGEFMNPKLFDFTVGVIRVGK